MIIPHAMLIGAKQLDESTDAQVNASTSDTITIQPPEGQFYKIKKIWFSIPNPSGSTSGTHEIRVTYDTTFTTQAGIIFCKATTGNLIYSWWNQLVGNNTEEPSADHEQQDLLSGGNNILVTNDMPLYVIYNNDTDANQTGTRRVVFLVEVWNNAI